MKMLQWKKAICYSGYREGQRPGGKMPTKEQIAEDLEILAADGYGYIRMYDPNEHAKMVLDIIREKKLPMKCMLGIDNVAEENAKQCIFGSQNYTEEQLQQHAKRNDAELEKLITFANEYKEEIAVVSVGNENRFELVGHLVPEDRLIRHVNRLHETVSQPVTFCELADDWGSLEELAKHVDVISIHSYPYHNGDLLEDAVSVNERDYKKVSEQYPDKEVCFTEVGWTTNTAHDDRPGYATVDNQKKYITELETWLQENQIVGFIFEAFDEIWKGDTLNASECNWGLYDVNRKRKW